MKLLSRQFGDDAAMLSLIQSMKIRDAAQVIQWLVSISFPCAAVILWALTIYDLKGVGMRIRGTALSIEASDNTLLAGLDRSGTNLGTPGETFIHYDIPGPIELTSRKVLMPLPFGYKSFRPSPVSISSTRFSWAGFAWQRAGHLVPAPSGRGFLPGAVWDGDVILMPFWFISLISAMPIGALLRRMARRRSVRRRGHCIRCGYDLRGTPYRCPECGMKNGKIQRG